MYCGAASCVGAVSSCCPLPPHLRRRGWVGGVPRFRHLPQDGGQGLSAVSNSAPPHFFSVLFFLRFLRRGMRSLLRLVNLPSLVFVMLFFFFLFFIVFSLVVVLCSNSFFVNASSSDSTMPSHRAWGAVAFLHSWFYVHASLSAIDSYECHMQEPKTKNVENLFFSFFFFNLRLVVIRRDSTGSSNVWTFGEVRWSSTLQVLTDFWGNISNFRKIF